MKIRLLFLFCILIVVVIVSVQWIFFQPNFVRNLNPAPLEIKIKSGMDLLSITRQLVEKKLVEHPTLFELAAKISRTEAGFQAGKYLISPGLTNWEIIKRLTGGKVKLERITIPEGKRFEFIASILQAKIEIDSTLFARLVHDSVFTHKLGIYAPTLNGYLFPDTYFFTWGMSEKQCIQAMVRQFKINFPDSIRDHDPELGLTRHEMVILASIIEGEVRIDSERPLISALYRNRLKRGMLLQACPTVQYLLPEGPRRLLNRDLEIDSPYNTYIHKGLPPGPINNPGRNSLWAAAYPEDVPYLFMVARGDGGHNFSRSLSGHLAAKRKFDAYRREVYRKKRHHPN